MYVFFASLLGCVPPDSAATTRSTTTGIRVELTVPSDLSTVAALDLALLEATLADFNNVVVVIDEVSDLDADTPLSATWRGTLTAGTDHVTLELCDPRRCRTHQGAARTTSLARQLGEDAGSPWSAPEGQAAIRAGRAARALYGFRSVSERDVGTPRDPVVVALEGTPTALAHWMHGRREDRAGRSAAAAWAFASVLRLRDSPRSRVQSAFAWHQAGWSDTAFDLVRDVQTDDARAFGPLARIAAARGRVARTSDWLLRLPDRPATHTLAYDILPSTAHLTRWAASSPDDASLRQARIRRALERQDVAALLVDDPSLTPQRALLHTAAQLVDVLQRAERVAEDVARAQNAFTSVRRRGRVPCDSPVRAQGSVAHEGLASLQDLRRPIGEHWARLEKASPVLQPTVEWLGNRVTAVARRSTDLARVQKSIVEARRCRGG